MGVGIEIIIILVLLAFGGTVVYWAVAGRRKKDKFPPMSRHDSSRLRWATIVAGVLLILVIALTLEFCSEQKQRMDKNTHEDNSLDNVGKGENEDDNRDDGDDTQR
jgi:heme/copper-type cytochrome/quinol oxidase subunit 2